MKHQKKNNLMPVICVLAAVVVVMIAVLAILMLRGGDESAPVESSAQLPQLETTQSSEGEKVSAPAEQSFGEGAEDILAAQEVDDVAIETPYTTLYYPGEWASALQVDHEEGEVYTVRFTAKLESGVSVPLFEIRLGGPVQDGFAFFLSEAGEAVAVNAEAFEFIPEEGMRDSEIITVYSMQEAMNEVLAGMSLLYTQVNGSEGERAPAENSTSVPAESGTSAPAQDILPEDNGEEMAIDTPGGTLFYPTRWADYLHLETEEGDTCSVTFYCRMEGHEDLELFIVYIGGEEGMPAGTITNADGESQELRLGVEELSLDGWLDEEVRIAYAMQEDLNYLLEQIN